MKTEDSWTRTTHSGECNECGTNIGSDPVTKIIIEQDNKRLTTVLCPACAVIECTDCGFDVSLKTTIDEREEIWTDTQLVECNRCDGSIPLRNAVELRHKQDPQYHRRLCGDCFEEITVPADYNVVRDFSVTDP